MGAARRERLKLTQIGAKTMGAIGEIKSQVRSFTADDHREGAKVLKGVFGHVEIDGLNRSFFGWEIRLSLS
jgi:hypothetical protein